jgi:hypothetical protein
MKDLDSKDKKAGDKKVSRLKTPKEEKPLYNEEESNKRMNIIGRNGNNGEHYEKEL